MFQSQPPTTFLFSPWLAACLSILIALSACQVGDSAETIEPLSSTPDKVANMFSELPGKADYASILDDVETDVANYLATLIEYQGKLNDFAVLQKVSRAHLEGQGYTFSETVFRDSYQMALSSAGSIPEINQAFWYSLPAYEDPREVLVAMEAEIQRLGPANEDNFLALLHLTLTKVTFQAVADHPELLIKFQAEDEQTVQDPVRCAAAVIGGAIVGGANGAFGGMRAGAVSGHPAGVAIGGVVGGVRDHSNNCVNQKRLRPCLNGPVEIFEKEGIDELT